MAGGVRPPRLDRGPGVAPRGAASPPAAHTSACARQPWPAASSAGSWARPRRRRASRSQLLARVMGAVRDDRVALGVELALDALEVERHRLPPAPVLADQLAEGSEVDRVGMSVVADREADEQAQAVVGVLLVELEDLQLGQQQVERVQRVRHQRQARRELERVAHVQLVDEHVDGQAGLAVGEVELLVAVERVEVLVGHVAALGQQRGQLLARLARRGEVEVLPGPRARWQLGGEHLDGQPADQAQGDAALRRRVDQRHCLLQQRALGDRVGHRSEPYRLGLSRQAPGRGRRRAPGVAGANARCGGRVRAWAERARASRVRGDRGRARRARRPGQPPDRLRHHRARGRGPAPRGGGAAGLPRRAPDRRGRVGRHLGARRRPHAGAAARPPRPRLRRAPPAHRPLPRHRDRPLARVQRPHRRRLGRAAGASGRATRSRPRSATAASTAAAPAT